jgi:hypothetical protein
MNHVDDDSDATAPHEQQTDAPLSRLEIARRIAREILRADRQDVEVGARLLRG